MNSKQRNTNTKNKQIQRTREYIPTTTTRNGKHNNTIHRHITYRKKNSKDNDTQTKQEHANTTQMQGTDTQQDNTNNTQIRNSSNTQEHTTTTIEYRKKNIHI